MKSASTKMPNGHGSLYKEVRFSPTATPIRRTQSISTSNPSLNSNHERTFGARLSPEDLDSALVIYLDQSRSLIESQRAHFETERALFSKERELWERERDLLKSRIDELESLLESRGERMGASASNPLLLRSHLGAQYDPSTTLSEQINDGNHFQVWEGSGAVSKPTRVFHDTEKIDGPVVPEQGLRQHPSLDAALSPRSHAVDPSACVSVPVPIEKLDSKLDGITLKSTALPPDVVARVMTPPSPSLLDGSPSPTSKPNPGRPSPEHKYSLKLKLSDLEAPDENLVRNAGHTPMAIIDGGIDLTQPTTSEGTPFNEENPIAPAATNVPQPVERADSYFPDLPEDPALKGPLSLLNDEEHDNSFLQELDQKLLDQARTILSNSSDSQEPKEVDAETASQGEQEPELKFKSTTNFGTAFGISKCGNF